MSEAVDRLFQKIGELPDEEKRKAILETEAEFFKSDLFATSKHLLGFKDMTWDTHSEIINTLESEARRKLICFPRGCFKSSIAVVSYTIWRLIRNPNLRILIDSEIYTNSSNFLRSIRSHLERPRMTELFGNFQAHPWGEGEITIAQRTRPFVEASITCGGVGTTKVGQHYDLIIGDDYNSPSNSSSPEKCQKIIDHYKYNLSILEPDGEYVIIGTRYSELDLIGWILRDLLGLTHLAEGKFTPEKGGLLQSTGGLSVLS